MCTVLVVCSKKMVRYVPVLNGSVKYVIKRMKSSYCPFKPKSVNTFLQFCYNQISYQKKFNFAGIIITIKVFVQFNL